MHEGIQRMGEVEPPTVSNERSATDHKAEAKRLLDTLDIAAIDALYREERTKSGIEADIDQRVVLFDDSGPLGSHLDGVISLNPVKIHEYAERKNVPFSQALLSTFFHETTHALGHNAVHTESPIPLLLLKSLVTTAELSQSGYSRQEIRALLPKDSFTLFNEGVTDAIASEVYDKYGTQTGSSDVRPGTFVETYVEQTNLLSSFIALVANKTQVPVKDVWNSIKQGYYSGVDLNDSAMGKLYNELALAELMKSLSHLERTDASSALLQAKIDFATTTALTEADIEAIKRNVL